MPHKVLRTVRLIGLGLLTLLVLSFVLQLEFPKPTGPYAVGRTTQRWVDLSRPEVVTDIPDDVREVPVEIWYPAEIGSGTKAPYFPDLARVAASLAASGEVTPLEVFGLRFIRTHELFDAQIARNTTSYPLVILSPGNGTNVEFYAGLADELASYGYIVVGINHPYDVAAVALQDERIAQFVAGPSDIRARQAWVAERIAVRTADVLFALDQLKTLNVSDDSPFTGRLDLTQVGVMGHSLGGITAAEACRANSQLRACLNLDGLQQGGPFSANENPVPPDQPFMMITKEPQLHPAILALFEAIPAGSYRVVIKGASHDSFTDGPLLLPSLLPVPNKADHILALTRAYILAFFNQTLKQQPSHLLEKPLQSPQVALEVYPAH